MNVQTTSFYNFPTFNVLDDDLASTLLNIYDKCGGNRCKLETFYTLDAMLASLEQAPTYTPHLRKEIENITNEIFLDVEDVSVFQFI